MSVNERPLKVGFHLPHVEDWMGGRTARWTDVLAIAKRAEEVGFDSLWVADHLLYEFPQGESAHGLWEAWTLLAAVAASTERIELGPVVACTGFRNPALLAKMADTLDEISGGRLILGLGAGYHDFEHRTFGYPSDHLVGRFEEALQIIHGLLRTGSADFEGQWYQMKGCELRPRGPRPEGPPIMIGAIANRPRMLRLVAQ
jgi:alkanesulfonate monooxygenase SsuD/methylene tetrahydromethanopterin reductase-like flavin-dependent oxidoreductase (luciferase family)